MKVKFIKAVGVAACLLLSGQAYGGTLKEGFVETPDSVKISCYWYWLSGNVTKEGVAKDLESMKKAGITRAFIGNMGIEDAGIEPGVGFMSDEWFGIMHEAMRKAKELGIEIGVFNCAGWSQAGGPWIKPEQSMRYLATATADIEGGRRAVALDVAKMMPAGAQPVKTLAVRIDEPEEVLHAGNSSISQGDMRYIGNVVGGDGEYFFANGGGSFSIKPKGKFTLRSIAIAPMEKPVTGKVAVFNTIGGNRSKIAEFEVNRYNDNLAVGFNPYAPVVVSVPAVEAGTLELVFSDFRAGSGLRSIKLSSAPHVERYPEKSLAKLHQTPLPYWNEYKWKTNVEVDAAYKAVASSDVVDVTAMVANGILKWKAPKGDWRIYQTYMLPTGVCNDPTLPDSRGLEVDKWDRKALAWHYANYIGKLLERIPASDRATWKYVVCDSYEKGSQNFSDDFIDAFKKKYGYDPVPYLPVFSGTVVESADKSDRFLWDVRRMMADRLSYDHIGAMREMANRDGLKLWLENYGHWGFPGEFLQYGGQSDLVAGEFWGEGDLGNIENRAASSCAHTYGKSKVFAESFTCGGPEFSRYPLLMKQRGDRFFTEGINSTLLHLYISQPDTTTLPGLNAWFGNEFNAKNTWFDQLDLFTQYLKRCNFMLQQGRYVADVAYFIGEDAPVMTGITDPALPKGYQFDYINAEILKSSATAGDNHELRLESGARYKLLVLPALETMRPELLRKIRDLVAAGAIVLGSEPLRSPSLENYPVADREVAALAAELWGENPPIRMKRKVGKGFIFKGYGIDEIFAELGVAPDCAIKGSNDILYSHNAGADTHIYFISNQSQQPQQFNAALRSAANCRSVELWNPVDGATKAAMLKADGSVDLQLAPLESVFVVLSSDASSDKPVETAFSNAIEISSPWEIEFKSIHGKDRFQKGGLFDWSKSTVDSIRHYSGEAIYRNSFVFKKENLGKPVMLETGKVEVIAKVRINGQYVGGLWCYPYRLDISKYLKAGRNEVEITVANTWVNRLVGDAALPDDKRGTHYNARTYTAKSPLQPSGLISPVRIIF